MDLPTSAELRSQIRTVLVDALSWQMSMNRWSQADDVLARIEQALAAGDSQKLTTATTDLELLGPVRILAIGSSDQPSAPPPVRDRLNRLVHVIGLPPADVTLDGRGSGSIGATDG